MAVAVAYTPALTVAPNTWTLRTPPNRENWTPTVAIGTVLDATTAPAAPAYSPDDPRSEPGIVTAVRDLLGSVPANTSQGLLAWTDVIEATRFTPLTSVGSDPGGYYGDGASVWTWVELSYNDASDLIAALDSSFGMGSGGLLLRSATVTAHLTFAGSGSGWDRNTTP